MSGFAVDSPCCFHVFHLVGFNQQVQTLCDFTSVSVFPLKFSEPLAAKPLNDKKNLLRWKNEYDEAVTTNANGGGVKVRFFVFSCPSPLERQSLSILCLQSPLSCLNLETVLMSLDNEKVFGCKPRSNLSLRR